MTRSEQIRPFLGAWPSQPCSRRRTPSRVRKPGPSPLRSLYSARIPGPVSRSGAARAPSGVSSCCSSPRAHRALITISACLSGTSCCRLNSSPASRTRPAGSLPRSAAAPRSGLDEIPDEPAIGERSRRAQRSRNRPAAPGSLQAVPGGVQVRSPARSARRGVSDNLAVDRHHAKQVRLGGTHPATDACPDH